MSAMLGCNTYRGVQVAFIVHGQVQLGLNALYGHHTQTHGDEIKHGCGVEIKKCRVNQSADKATSLSIIYSPTGMKFSLKMT